jgi:hypothetical protein
VPKHSCLVLIPARTGSNYTYDVGAESSMEAAAKALGGHHEPLTGDAVITVIVEGKSLLLWKAAEYNAGQPTFRHSVEAVRRWANRREWERIFEQFVAVGIHAA